MQNTELLLGRFTQQDFLMIQEALTTYQKYQPQQEIPIKWSNFFTLLWLGLKKFSNFILELVGLQITSLLLEKKMNKAATDLKKSHEDFLQTLGDALKTIDKSEQYLWCYKNPQLFTDQTFAIFTLIQDKLYEKNLKESIEEHKLEAEDIQKIQAQRECFKRVNHYENVGGINSHIQHLEDYIKPDYIKNRYENLISKLNNLTADNKKMLKSKFSDFLTTAIIYQATMAVLQQDSKDFLPIMREKTFEDFEMLQRLKCALVLYLGF
jgi:hypothetical protein